MLRNIFSFLVFIILAAGEGSVIVILWIEAEEPISYHPQTAVVPRRSALLDPTPCIVTFTAETVFSDGADSAVVTIKLPPTIDGVQSFTTSQQTDPRVVIFRNGDYAYAQALVKPGEPSLVVELRGRLARPRTYAQVRMQFAVDGARPSDASLKPPHPRYLVQERWSGEKVALITRMAGQTNAVEPAEVAAWAFQRCRESLNYERNGRWIDLDDALRSGEGDCTEFSDFFISLCRAKGVAARACLGWSGSLGRGFGGHQWAEIFDPEFGWIMVDPTYADDASTSYDIVSTRVLFTGRERGHWQLQDQEYVGWFTTDGSASGAMEVEIVEDTSQGVQ